MSEQLQLDDEDISIALRRAWDRALRELSTRVNKPTFEAHIRNLRPLAMADGQENGLPLCSIVLGVHSEFTRNWVETRHGVLIQQVLEELLDRDVRITFKLVAKSTAAKPAAQTLSLFGEDEAPREERPKKPVPTRPSERPYGAERMPSPERPLALSPEAEPLLLEPTPALAPSRTARVGDGGPVLKTTRGADAPTLNPRFTFDGFVVGPTNRLAHGGSYAVSQSPGQVYNPLFLYGPPGMGKTHLMHAIGHEATERVGTNRVVYVSSEAFTSAYVQSIKEKRTEEFRRRWRSIDVFLLDDVQFLLGKERTQEEFFHTFNALQQLGKQVVLSSDRSPRELNLDERLRSRFESGLIAELAPPDLETRLAILQKKAATERMRIPDDVLLYMAQLVQSNIRTLEGALVKLVAYASLVNSPVTTRLATDVLERYYIAAGIVPQGGFSGQPGESGLPQLPSSPLPGIFSGSGAHSKGVSARLSADVIQDVVARRFGLDAEALKGKKRDKETARARQIAMHLMRELTETSLPGIGHVFGGRDHTTVLHACNNIREQLPLDTNLKSLVEELLEQIKRQSQA